MRLLLFAGFAFTARPVNFPIDVMEFIHFTLLMGNLSLMGLPVTPKLYTSLLACQVLWLPFPRGGNRTVLKVLQPLVMIRFTCV